MLILYEIFNFQFNTNSINMKKASISTLIAVLSVLFISSCKELEKDVPFVPSFDKYEAGAFFINEGNFQHGNGSITYLNTTDYSVKNDIFQLENNRSLGDVVQSMKIVYNTAYICVNNSNKIEVVNSKSFEELGTVYNLPSVRYFDTDYSDYGYATCWGNGGQVKVINLSTLEVIDSIMVGNGPEGMFIWEQKLFVANGGNTIADNTVSVISLQTKELIATIPVGYSPKHFVIDVDSKLWVICAGTGNWSNVGEQESQLIQIDPVNLEVINTVPLFNHMHPENIGIDRTQTVIIIGGGFDTDGLYKVFTSHPETPTEAFINGSFYGMSISPFNDEIYAADAKDYSNNGLMNRYSFNGDKLGEYETGIIPNSVCFRWPVMITIL